MRPGRKRTPPRPEEPLAHLVLAGGTALSRLQPGARYPAGRGGQGLKGFSVRGWSQAETAAGAAPGQSTPSLCHTTLLAVCALLSPGAERAATCNDGAVGSSCHGKFCDEAPWVLGRLSWRRVGNARSSQGSGSKSQLFLFPHCGAAWSMFTSRPLVAILLLHPHCGTAPASWSGAQGHAGASGPCRSGYPPYLVNFIWSSVLDVRHKLDRESEKNIPLLICAEDCWDCPLCLLRLHFPPHPTVNLNVTKIIVPMFLGGARLVSHWGMGWWWWARW